MAAAQPQSTERSQPSSYDTLVGEPPAAVDEGLTVLLTDPITLCASPSSPPENPQVLRVLLYLEGRTAAQVKQGPVSVQLIARLWGSALMVKEELEPECVWPLHALQEGKPCLCWIKSSLGKLESMLDDCPAVLLLQLKVVLPGQGTQPVLSSGAAEATQAQQLDDEQPPVQQQPAAGQQQQQRHSRSAAKPTPFHQRAHLSPHAPGNVVFLLVLPKAYTMELKNLWARMQNDMVQLGAQAMTSHGQTQHLELVEGYCQAISGSADKPPGAAASTCPPDPSSSGCKSKFSSGGCHTLTGEQQAAPGSGGESSDAGSSQSPEPPFPHTYKPPATAIAGDNSPSKLGGGSSQPSASPATDEAPEHEGTSHCPASPSSTGGTSSRLAPVCGDTHPAQLGSEASISQAPTLLHQVIAWHGHLRCLHEDLAHVLLNGHFLRLTLAEELKGVVKHLTDCANTVPTCADSVLMFLNEQHAPGLHALVVSSMNEMREHAKKVVSIMTPPEAPPAPQPPPPPPPQAQATGPASSAQAQSSAGTGFSSKVAAAAAVAKRRIAHVADAPPWRASAGQQQGVNVQQPGAAEYRSPRVARPAAGAAAGLRRLASMLESPKLNQLLTFDSKPRAASAEEARQTGPETSAVKSLSQRRSLAKRFSSPDQQRDSAQTRGTAGTAAEQSTSSSSSTDSLSRGSTSADESKSAQGSRATPPPPEPKLRELVHAMLHGFEPTSLEATYVKWQEQQAVKLDYIIFWLYVVALGALVLFNIARLQNALHSPESEDLREGGSHLLHALPIALVPIKLLAFSSAWLLRRSNATAALIRKGGSSSGEDAPEQHDVDDSQAHQLSGRTRLVAISFILEGAWWLGQAGVMGAKASMALAPLHMGLIFYENPLKALLVQAPFRQLWPILLSSACAALPTLCASRPWPSCSFRPLTAAMLVLLASALGDLRFRWKYCNAHRQHKAGAAQRQSSS